MRRAMSSLLLLCLFLAHPAWGQAPEAFAELSVVAYGTQRLDLVSGLTVLEDGGEVIDQASGMRLVAAWIAYAEGQTLEARDAQLDGAVGQVRAAELFIDLQLGRVEAAGGVALLRPGLVVEAGGMGVDPSAGLAWLIGEVVATEPSASAAEAWIDLDDGRILLLGEYRYHDGLFELQGGAGTALQLDPIDLQGQATYDVRTEVDGAFLARVQGLRERMVDPAAEAAPSGARSPAPDGAPGGG